MATLWSISPAWRLVVVSTVGSAALFALSRWIGVPTTGGNALATYQAPAPSSSASITPQMPRVSQAANAPQSPVGPQTDILAAASAMTISAPSQSAPSSSGRASASSAQPLRSPVRWRSESDGMSAASAGSISGAGLVAGYCCAGAFSSVFADTGVARGRHYLELTFTAAMAGQHPDTWTGAGVAVDAADGDCTRTAPRGPGSGPVTGWRRSMVDRDVIMLAIDADNRRAYWGLNGQWRDGDPETSAGGQAIAGQGAVRPYVTISASSSLKARAPQQHSEADQWIANFGAQPFRFPMPAGYQSFGTYSAVSTAPGGSRPLSTPRTTAEAVVTDEFGLLGKTVPLPGGNWHVIARMAIVPARDEVAVLAMTEGAQLREMVAVRVQKLAGSNAPLPEGCTRTDVFFTRMVNNDSGKPVLCTWINHAASIWSQPLFSPAWQALIAMQVRPPATLINTGVHKRDAEGSVTAFYYLNPESRGISTPAGTWSTSPWHASRVSQSPEKLALLKDREQWASSWLQLFRVTK